MKITEGYTCRWIGTKNFCCDIVEYEDESSGGFRMFATKCHGETHYSVTDKEGEELKSFKDLKSARIDINERHAVILKDKQDKDLFRQVKF